MKIFYTELDIWHIQVPQIPILSMKHFLHFGTMKIFLAVDFCSQGDHCIEDQNNTHATSEQDPCTK